MTIKTVYYYSLSGKTEAITDNLDLKKVRMNNYKPEDFYFSDEGNIIFIGSPTYGRGVPPIYFKKILPELKRLKDKKIGLFGSGNTIYGEDFCGALDVLEELLKEKNEIVFKYKFEGMPQEKDYLNLKNLIENMN